MINFNPNETENFLATVRKYMQLRGGMSQKDLAVKLNIGISTMSRFMSQKTKELDEQLIANIVASLNIPLHEIIEFVEEESTTRFKNLVAFYKGDQSADKQNAGTEDIDPEMAGFEQGLGEEQTRTRTSASIKGVKVPFGERRSGDNGNLSIRDKLNQLSPRQKGFLTDFLDLDVEGRDLIVDVSNSLFRYFKQRSADF